ncbi:ornithine decarboxylase [Oenococcus oeni]|uniref:ornithine decarboxylase n=1 Tax=Oenococcus oeni TaxID=1247 RepID=Q5ZH57_OENOE|nr:ornithine decarboxylase [Oenococcus oeni]CAG34069.1 ornithine decarboxylase [Oenococcus oeni]CBY85123.1 ornithine decarboxylase [Oenococcus oeni]CBY85126.1 ornithine decarboxylase [Oenococcus oeni]CBY85127.1 ornithine decarboxylase [Oenococcus oeni]
MDSEINDDSVHQTNLPHKFSTDELKIASTAHATAYFDTNRTVVDADNSDFVDVAAVVVMDDEKAIINKADETKFNIPIFIITDDSSKVDGETMSKIFHIIDWHNNYDRRLYDREIEAAAKKYEDGVLPPFFKALKAYVERGNIQFDCPGHQGGQYFRKSPAGREFYNFYGENIFRSDICNADVDLGDLLIHEGPAMDAEKHAARVFNADKTYFVMNGTTTSNNIAITAAVAPGDLVLFDRNNHKSVYNAALVQAGGRPVYLETSRDSYGFIGGIYSKDFDEKSIREKIAKVDPEKAKAKRPFRLAVIQLGTYDGTIYNAKQVVERIGHLCDYILFDSAWVGYEQFIPMMKDSSPLLLNLGPDDPGILVTQSTHKQQAGFSQASQIHKKDSHIKGQKRYINHKQFNNAYMKFSSTSPFYPLFATLDINAKMQEGEAGKKLWHDALVTSVNARKNLLKNATMIKPFLPPVVHGKPWQDADTEKIVSDIDYWKFEKGAKWHGFDGYADNQYFVDPNKFMLTTPGIDVETGEYEDFGIPAVILANYLREHGIIPEKNDLNSILFLMTPAETQAKMDNLVTQIVKFESLVKADAPLDEVLPRLYSEHQDRYEGYTIKQLCQEVHDFYKNNNTKEYQKEMFLGKYFPEQAMTPYQANVELLKNNAKLVPLTDIEGLAALEGALPYPPGIFCIVPGEKWTKVAQKYFLILEESINRFPGFAPEIQGVYFEKENGKSVAYGYVYDKSKDEEKR